MSPSYEQLREAALSLPPDQRLELADMLSISLRLSSPEGDPSPEFLAELKRRSAEMDEDPSASLSWDEVRAEIEKPVPA